MATNTYYVQARLDASGNFADCLYFSDPACTQAVSDILHIGREAGACQIVQAAGSELLLVGGVFKTLGHAPSLNSHNFTPADDEHSVRITMPTTSVVTKGVVLMFANAGEVQSLYPSSDPQIVNDDV